MSHSLPDHPVIQNLICTGHPDRQVPTERRCPVCGAEAEGFYTTKTRSVVGCDICLTRKYYYEFEKGELQ